MPYKARLKTGDERKRKKTAYKVINWPEYNQSLKRRGNLSLYFPRGDLKEAFYNEASYVKGLAGRDTVYKPAYIELIFTFYRLMNLGLRQITGFFEDRWSCQGVDIPVPSFGRLSDLFSEIPVKARHFCEKVKERLNKGEDVTLIVDSTGLRFPKARHWYKKTYGADPEKLPFRKLHLSIDPAFESYVLEVTEQDISDREIMDALIPEDMRPSLRSLIADGGYYDHKVSQALYEEGITPVIPPPKTAVVHGKSSTAWHDTLVSYIQQKGSVYAFHKKYRYGLRARIEAYFSSLKRCIGRSFKTIKIESQEREAIIMGNIMNLWNSFGRPVCVKTG